MKYIIVIIITVLLFACNSNTIYKKPKDLIPRDSMIMLLQDMYTAVAAKNYRTTNGDRFPDYTNFVYSKYGIDSTRFTTSNIYYTSKIVAYQDILSEVKARIDTLIKVTKLADTIKEEEEKNVNNKKTLELPQ